MFWRTFSCPGSTPTASSCRTLTPTTPTWPPKPTSSCGAKIPSSLEAKEVATWWTGGSSVSHSHSSNSFTRRWLPIDFTPCYQGNLRLCTDSRCPDSDKKFFREKASLLKLRHMQCIYSVGSVTLAAVVVTWVLATEELVSAVTSVTASVVELSWAVLVVSVVGGGVVVGARFGASQMNQSFSQQNVSFHWPEGVMAIQFSSIPWE